MARRDTPESQEIAAYRKVVRLKSRLAHLRDMLGRRTLEYNDKIAAVQSELTAAEKALGEFQNPEPPTPDA